MCQDRQQGLTFADTCRITPTLDSLGMLELLAALGCQKSAGWYRVTEKLALLSDGLCSQYVRWLTSQEDLHIDVHGSLDACVLSGVLVWLPHAPEPRPGSTSSCFRASFSSASATTISASQKSFLSGFL